MSRNLRVYLEDILVSGAKILRYSQGMKVEDFVNYEKTYNAVVRNLQIIGEAVKNVPLEVRINIRKLNGEKLQD